MTTLQQPDSGKPRAHQSLRTHRGDSVSQLRQTADGESITQQVTAARKCQKLTTTASHNVTGNPPTATVRGEQTPS